GRVNIRLVLKGLILAVCFFGFAIAVPAQRTSYAYSVTVSNHPLYDASIGYHRQGSSIDSTQSLEMRIHHLANGKINGTGSVASLTKDYNFAGNGNVWGRYRQLPLGDRCAFDFTARIMGEDAAGFPVRGSYLFRGLFLQRSGPDFYTAGTNVICINGYMCTGTDELFMKWTHTGGIGDCPYN